MPQRPIADGIFTEGPRPQLIAGRCEDCGVVAFPRQASCPKCTGGSVVERLLPDVGVLWSWTVQRFPPKPPYRSTGDFVPYGVGYVEFPGECIVEGRLTTADPQQLRIGSPMRLTLVENHQDEQGGSVLVHAFAPEEVVA